MSIAPSSKSKSSRIPTSLNTTIHSTVEPDMLSVSSRQRQSKKDEAIRKKIEQELSKKRGNSTRIRQTRKIAGTVSALRPAQALTVRESILVIEAAQLMAAKRSDCVLVVDEEEHLSGIFTAKDLAYRVVADNLDARAITVSDIMTRNPMCVTADTSAQDALNLMVSRGFRHLAYGSSRKLYDALEGVEREWANSPVQLVQYMEALKDKMSCPDLTTVLDHAGPVQVTMKAQVREVAKLMKEYHTTAVLVMDHGGLAGIFTSKDIVLRVIAAGLAPDSCSVVRVMTPHPDTALPSTSILDALKKMHDGHYLNLPVLDEDKNIVGLIDVLRLTYATLEQINSIEGNQGDGSKFWHSIAGGDQTESDSVISESLSHAANSPLFQNEHAILPMPGHAPTYTGLGYSELTPADSASGIHDNDNTSTVSSHINNTFSFKFNYANKTHRFRHDIGNFANFLETIQQKIMTEHLSLSQSYVAVHHKEDENWLTVAYVDDENDQVLMTCDSDLIDSVQIAKKAGMDRVRLFVHDSMAEEQSSIVDQQQLTIEQPVTPPVIPEPVIQKKPVKRKENTEEKDRVSVEKKKRHVKPEYDLPIPQDLVLPAAITFLGVVILGVFTISRLSAK
ncbi:hypothetical protein G6F61_003314 [Rhizopus arrhizus]|nr:hypothetical protein G6F61_003314 [Rhizopus arrhizus]